MYNISMLERRKLGDGREAIVFCDDTIELLAQELENIGLSLPFKPGDEETICDHFQMMDAEIGGMEMDGIRPTPEYDTQVCRAVDEFMDDTVENIDFNELAERVRKVLDAIRDGTYEPHVKKRWMEPEPKRKPSAKGKKRKK